MSVNPVILEAFSKTADHWYLVQLLAGAIKSGDFPPKGSPMGMELFPKYRIYGMEVTEEAIREARVLACTM